MPYFHKTRIQALAPSMVRCDVKVLVLLIPVKLLNFPCNLARQLKMVSKYSLISRLFPQLKTPPPFHCCEKPHCPFAPLPIMEGIVFLL